MHCIVLNLGLKSIRSIIFDATGAKRASFSLPVNTYLKGFLVEQDPVEWWDKAVQVIQKTLEDNETRKLVRFLTARSSSKKVRRSGGSRDRRRETRRSLTPFAPFSAESTPILTNK